VIAIFICLFVNGCLVAMLVKCCRWMVNFVFMIRRQHFFIYSFNFWEYQVFLEFVLVLKSKFQNFYSFLLFIEWLILKLVDKYFNNFQISFGVKKEVLNLNFMGFLLLILLYRFLLSHYFDLIHHQKHYYLQTNLLSNY